MTTTAAIKKAVVQSTVEHESDKMFKSGETYFVEFCNPTFTHP